MRILLDLGSKQVCDAIAIAKRSKRASANTRPIVRNILGRIWSGIVGVVAGVSLGFLLIIVLLAMQISLDIVWTVTIFGIVGGLAGFGLGNKKLGGR